MALFPARPEPVADVGRIAALDMARGMSVVGMIVFHFVRDLEFFGWLPYGATLLGGWPVFARLVAGSFLALSGVSLFLAHGAGIRWRPFLRRLAVLVLAAAGVSLVTWIAMPQAFVHFGILHVLALSSVLGLACLRLPVTLLIALAVVVWVLPDLARSTAFDHPWLWWLGLSAHTPPSLDFEPILPWFTPFLGGIATAKILRNTGWLPRIARCPDAVPGLSWLGRNALPVYLIHQPVLLAVLWLTQFLTR